MQFKKPEELFLKATQKKLQESLPDRVQAMCVQMAIVLYKLSFALCTVSPYIFLPFIT